MTKKLVGYGDVLSVEQGREIRFSVSSAYPEYRADLVRLIQGDVNEHGPGFQEEEIASSIDGSYAGSEKTITPGSYVRVDDSSWLAEHGALTVALWIHPTNPGMVRQALISKAADRGSARPAGFDLFLDESGAAALWLGSAGSTLELHLAQKSVKRTWSFVAATFDGSDGSVRLSQWRPRHGWETVSGVLGQSALQTGSGDLVMAAASTDVSGNVGSFFNGKLEAPTLLSAALDAEQLAALAQDPGASDSLAIARWDFSLGISSVGVRDVIGGLDGAVANMPTRAVTGHAWSGSEYDWTHATAEYSAIHFHDDDLDDVSWSTDFVLPVPGDLRSGLYAIRLRAEDEDDHIPFVVRPARGRSGAPFAVVLPTLTYLAYGNEAIAPPHPVATRAAEDDYITEQRFVSQYNVHSDGSGVAFASRRRPLLSLRPRYRYWLTDVPFGLAADLHLLSWLDREGIAYDLLTDEDLHHDGADLLRNYRVVATGTHPEYVTEPMMDAWHQYVDEGNRVMYLGGNGFYEVTGIHPERPWITEIRRINSAHAGLWDAQPGEMHLATTGEQGGHWRSRRQRARSLVGVEFGHQSYDESSPYERLEASHDPRFSWVFDGLAANEVIGDFGLVMGGAASVEIDAVDYDLGTPQETVVLARAEGFRGEFTKAHADMTFRPHGDGGVFSVSSIGWCGSLPWNDYDNNVAKITGNVLRTLLGDASPWQIDGAARR